jgi:hypothetical protein
MKKTAILFAIIGFAVSLFIMGGPVFAQTWHVDSISGKVDTASADTGPWGSVTVSNTLPACKYIRLTGRNTKIQLKRVQSPCNNFATIGNYEKCDESIIHLVTGTSPAAFIEWVKGAPHMEILEYGTCGANDHCGLRSPLADAYPANPLSPPIDTLEFYLWHLFSYQSIVANLQTSDDSILVTNRVTVVTTGLQPGKVTHIWPSGSQATDVFLAFFDASQGESSITITWATADEIGNAGFNVYRSTSLDGEYTKLNSELIPANANAFEGAFYSYTDKDVQTGLTYYYKLEDLSLDGTGTFHGPVSAKVSVSVPSNFALAQNYPNPFNASTMISYDLKTDSKVSLKIYNILGQEVTTLVDKYQSAGSYTVTWNSKDSKGNDVSTGVYFYLLKAGDFSANKKMTYLK